MRRNTAALAFAAARTAAGIVACGGGSPGGPLPPGDGRASIDAQRTRRRRSSTSSSSSKRTAASTTSSRPFPARTARRPAKPPRCRVGMHKYCRDNGMPVITKPTSVPLTKPISSDRVQERNFDEDTDLDPHSTAAFRSSTTTAIWTASTWRDQARTAPGFPSAPMRTNTSNPRRSRRIGISRSTTCLPITRFRRKAAAASPHTKI